jgi:hypothetical protein
MIVGVFLEGSAWPPDGWRMPTVIVNQTGQQKFPEIYVKGDTIHTIWIDNRDGYYRLYYKRSTDAGYTWSTDVIISQPNEVLPDRKRNISIAGRNNYIYVVYGSQPLSYELRFIRSSDNGSNWSSYKRLATNLSDNPDPSICAASDSIRVAYSHYTGIDDKIYYCASGNNGTSWYNDFFDSPVYPAECPDITTINNRPYVSYTVNPGDCGLIYCAKHTAGSWQVFFVNSGGLWSEFVFPHINADVSGNLYVVFEDTVRRGPELGSIFSFRSTNDGANWIGNFISPGNREGSDFIVLGGDSILITSGNQNVTFGQVVLFTPTEADPRNPFIISSEYTDPPACKPHTCIALGRFARHLIFHTGFASSQNLAYIANEDSLLSNDEAATARNNGRHLIRDPFSGGLHLVYQSQLMVHYAESYNGGVFWQPFHIMENPITQEKEDGRYPTVGLVPGMFIISKPCVVYLQGQGAVQYRWFDDYAAQWHGFTVLPVTLGLEAGPPSIYTQGNQVYLVCSVTHLVQGWSAIYFYQFTYNATAPPVPVMLDYIGWQGLTKGNPTITVDGNGNPHVAWSRVYNPGGDEEIYYSCRTAGSWSQPLNISDQLDRRSAFPNIDCYGNWLSAVWNDEVNGQFDEVWRNRKYIYPPPGLWFGKYPISQSPGIVSEFAVNASHDFTVWNELPASNFDIRYYSDTHGYGWVSQHPEKEHWCHSQLQRDYSPWDLYTVFTRGNNLPYRIICVHGQYGADPPRTGSPLYSVEPGDTTLSPFCRHRDSRIDYGAYQVDYGDQDLTYELSLLDPTFPYHRIKGSIYFSGNGNKTHEVWINGEKKASFAVAANQVKDFEFLLPRSLYENDHKLTISLKNPQNNGAYLAGLKVYRVVATDTIPGGPQSNNSAEMINSGQLKFNPDPFTDRTTITIAGITHSNQTISVKIYDADGRLVRKWVLKKGLTDRPTTFIWDGSNGTCQTVPTGIYFIRVETGNGSLTGKIIKIR